MAGTAGDAPAGDASVSGGSSRPRATDVTISVRSALAVLTLLAVTVLALEIARHSERVIAWVFVAGAIAVLVYPAVELGARWLPRVLVVVLLVLLGLGAIGFVGYRLVNDVANATDSLQDAAPKRAAHLEKTSDLLRQVHFHQRVQTFVNDIPKRLAGGSATKALESAATSGVAFLAGLILTIFFLIYGPRIFRSAIEQIRDPGRRSVAERVVVQGVRRGLDYARLKVLESLLEGVVAYVVARAAGVPGPAALGVWFALWTLLPIAGVFVGALPIVLFAGASSLTRAIVVATIFVVIGTAEFLFATFVERDTVEVSSFLVIFSAFAGLELDGITGALLAILAVVVLVAILDELGRAEAATDGEVAPATRRRE